MIFCIILSFISNDNIALIISNFVTALIGIGGVLITSFCAFKRLQKTNMCKLISESRNIWINEMREYISKMLSIANKEQNQYKSSEYYYYRNQVLNRLNLKECKHIALKEQIKKLDQCSLSNNYYDLCEKNILAISRCIFKEEWERVKKEAKGEF